MLLVVIMVKFWFYGGVICKILDEDEQQTTFEMKHNESEYKFTSSFVYSKCKDLLTRPLWDKML